MAKSKKVTWTWSLLHWYLGQHPQTVNLMRVNLTWSRGTNLGWKFEPMRYKDSNNVLLFSESKEMLHWTNREGNQNPLSTKKFYDKWPWQWIVACSIKLFEIKRTNRHLLRKAQNSNSTNRGLNFFHSSPLSSRIFLWKTILVRSFWEFLSKKDLLFSKLLTPF